MPLIKATHKSSGITVEGRAVKTPSGNYLFAEINVRVNDIRWQIERLTPELPEKPGTVIDIFEYDGETFTPPVRAMLCAHGIWALARDTGRGAHVFPDLIDDFEVVLP